MSTIFLFLNAMLPIVLQVLQKYTGLDANTASLISVIEQAASTFAVQLKDPNANSVTLTSILTALTAGVEMVQAQHPDQIDAKDLAIVSAFVKAANAGITAANAVTTVDPDTLKPIEFLS